jgi:hypothetical protein
VSVVSARMTMSSIDSSGEGFCIGLVGLKQLQVGLETKFINCLFM